MSSTAAILFQPDAFDTSGRRLMGRQSAGEGFLRGLIRHGSAERVFCYTSDSSSFDRFCALADECTERVLAATWIPTTDPMRLAVPGAVFRPDPMIARLAWDRNRFGRGHYSVCGIAHTVGTDRIMSGLLELLLAPLHSWDAIVCPSHAVKGAIENILRGWTESAAASSTVLPAHQFVLPVIPLGVDCTSFPKDMERDLAREEFRARFRIPSNAVVVLYLGRLDHTTKVNPVPLYIALGTIRSQLPIPLVLLEAGWFENEVEQRNYEEAARLFCPQLRVVQIDARRPDIRRRIWACADIFVSLSDNVQETFGLTPVEAMAAGLPVIASEWNGYRETVRDGIDGFLIPTYMPPEGTWAEVSSAYYAGRISWSQFGRATSITTAADCRLLQQYLLRLVENTSLRIAMGQAGQRRAADTFDWRVIIPQYERMWLELASRRRLDSVQPQQGSEGHPVCGDAAKLFHHYASLILSDELVVETGPMNDRETLHRLFSSALTSLGAASSRAAKCLWVMSQTIARHSAMSVRELQHACQRGAGVRHGPDWFRLLGYALKFDILRLQLSTGVSVSQERRTPIDSSDPVDGHVE